MQHKSVIKAATKIISVLLAIVTLLVMGIFTLVPAAANFTNVLILTMVMMQLLTVVVLIHIHDVLIGDVKRRR